MITQAIKRWLRNVFAWWPWKHTAPVAYRQASGPLGMNTSQEGISLSAVEGTTPQASITPRLSTIEERTISAHIPATNDMAETPIPPSLRSPVDISTEPGKDDASPAVPSTPTPQQRLEFLRYLVKRGIVNEGSEEM
jgi:hypothetical protein